MTSIFRKCGFLGLVLLTNTSACHAQFGGGGMGAFGTRPTERNYAPDQSPAANERWKRSSTGLGDANSTYIDASILMNVLADEYVVMFGVSEEAPNFLEASGKMNATLAAFRKELSALRVPDKDIFVDTISQNKFYNYKFVDKEGNPTYRVVEELAGFVVKKNVMIHFKDKPFIDKLTQAAAKAQIFDLIKMDYVVANTQAIQERLRAEASQILLKKAAQHEATLKIKLGPPVQLVMDSPSIYYPTEQYQSYEASESDNLTRLGSDRYTVQSARKTRTFLFNPLDGSDFDKVINPVVGEPVVQFTMYLKVRYQTGEKVDSATQNRGFGFGSSPQR